jgi:hypothetical protein
MKDSSAVVFRENYRLSEMFQIINYLQQFAASGINFALLFNRSSLEKGKAGEELT